MLWGSLSSLQILRSALDDDGGNDLYTYWYAGLHIRQGSDPYRAFLDGKDPVLPIAFLDGLATDKREIVRPELQPAPGLTLPLILLLTPFAWLSFQSAKVGWFILLILANLLIPALLLRALLVHKKTPLPAYLLILAVFMGFSSTRYASISGQPSIIVIALMLLTWIWAKDRPVLAGLLLGIALSKYSLALGFWIYFSFIEWRPKLSLTAAGVQILGILGLAWLGEASVMEAINGYIQLFLHHAPMEGIQLTSLLPGIDAYSPPLALGLTAGVGIPLAILKRRYKTQELTLASHTILRTTNLTLLTFWSLMVAYHRAYDLQVFVIMVGLILMIWDRAEREGSPKVILVISSLYLLLSILVLSLPAGSLLRQFLRPEFGSVWIRVILRSSTWVVLLGMGLCLAFLFRLTARTSQL